MTTETGKPYRFWPRELITVGYIAAIAQTALSTGVAYVLFPELGALAHDVFARPRGTWARAPLMLVLTPTLAALLGTLIAQHMRCGVDSVVLGTLGGMAIIGVLRSPVAPAISAGLLPVIFGIQSWWYPPSILFGTAALAIASIIHRRWADHGDPADPEPEVEITADIIERPPSRYGWLPFFMLFVVVAAALAQATGWRALLVPPLVVTGFEMFAHADICPWAQRPLVLPLACTLTATAGLGFGICFGPGPLAAAGAVLAGIVILKGVRLHVPPAIAIGLLPLLIEHPSHYYPLAVGIGSSILVSCFLIYGFVDRRMLVLPRA